MGSEMCIRDSFLPDGKILSVSGSRLMFWKNGETATFIPFHTLTDLNGTLARITTNAEGTKIVFVVTGY